MTLTRHSRDTHATLTQHSRDTQVTLMRHSRDTHMTLTWHTMVVWHTAVARHTQLQNIQLLHYIYGGCTMYLVVVWHTLRLHDILGGCDHTVCMSLYSCTRKLQCSASSPYFFHKNTIILAISILVKYKPFQINKNTHLTAFFNQFG